MGYEQKTKKNLTRVSGCVQNVSYGVRLIDSPAERLGTGGAISESPSGATSAARAPNPPLISLPCVLGLDEAEKPAKAKDSFRRAKRTVSRRWS
jgi:hypothetical protein